MRKSKNLPESKILPNTFQKPNWIVEKVMRYLSGNEYKCLDVVIRKTLGWWKSRDRISHSQIMELTGLSDDTVGSCMGELIKYGLVLKTNGNNKKNQGNEYELQLYDKKVNLNGLTERSNQKAEKDKAKTIKAREVQAGVLNTPTPDEQPPSGDVEQGTQKPLSKTTLSPSSEGAQPLKANQIPELVLFRSVTSRYPARANFEDVIASIQKIKARLGKDELVRDDILNFYKQWCAKGYRENSLAWLEWAESGVIPQNGNWKSSKYPTEPKGFDAVRKFIAKHEGAMNG